MAIESPTPLYLDLLKKTLSFSLWPEPPVPLTLFNSRRTKPKQMIATLSSKVVALAGLQLSKPYWSSDASRAAGEMWPSYAHTMVGMKRLDNIQYAVETVLKDNVPGDLIETGVWRGGSCILMRGILAAHGVKDRRVFVADSFRGLPPPDAKTYPQDANDSLFVHEFLAVSKQDVEQNFAKYGLLDEKVVFLEGWFKDTLPKAPVEKLAVMRLDGDMYGSTIEALEPLYPKLSPGGFCIIDDYTLPGCRAAVHDYRDAHGITEPIQEIDGSSRFWRRAAG
jgi:O-methyltransferase